MTESLCSCCKLLGKPPARINFIITTGQPDSLLYPRTKYLLKHYADNSSLENDTNLTNYETLMDISKKLFDRQENSLAIEQSTVTQTCCHGFTIKSVGIDDISSSSQLETFQKGILDLLDMKTDLSTDEKDTKCKSPSWIMMSGPMCLETALLNVFLRLQDETSSLLSYTLTLLCFLVNEQRLFQNWFHQDLPIENYLSNFYPKYQHAISNFFLLLNSSKYLQNNTLLINEEEMLTDDQLLRLLQVIFRNESSKYRAKKDQYRYKMSQLLSPRRRTIRDVFNVRNSLQKLYIHTVDCRLKPLFTELQQISTAANAARQICHLVLDEIDRLNNEEWRVYRRRLTLGFRPSDAKRSNTIAASLVRYALHLLENEKDTSIPLIYSIVLVICELGAHTIFRHELFNHTPEIYTLSLSLISQRQYALTLSGLRLCLTILDGDRTEYKYAMAYLAHETSSARKILDAIHWLLSPYLTLENLWKKEEEEENETENGGSKSDEKESPAHIAERFGFSHARILFERSYISGVASLFYGSAEHCVQVTQDDVHKFAAVISVLNDRRMIRWRRRESTFHCSAMLISDLCSLLTPILLYGLPAVNLALLNVDHLLISISRAIKYLFESKSIDETRINTCVRFYAQFIQSKCKQEEIREDAKDEEVSKLSDEKPTGKSLDPSSSLNISEDLISSYYNLYRQIQETTLLDEKTVQREQIQNLLKEDWKKLDTLQLQHNYEQLKREYMSLKEELSQLRNELQRTQSERDQFRKENMQMAQEIDILKRMSSTNTTVEVQQLPAPIAIITNKQDDTIDDLENLSPKEITKEQAEKYIQTIYHRRTTFNDPDMRKSICGSLKHLGSDLYSSPVHFLHEIIQNAEDNAYDNTVIPCLRIELNHNYILLSNNEYGLRVRDVLALCSLAVSTKTSEEEHIGEKGVGFKSVFAASNQPMLISHAWKFCFQIPGSDGMSYITPIWIEEKDIPSCISQRMLTHPDDTYLYLPLKLPAHSSEAELFLTQVTTTVDPCILLNMRRLKKLQIIDQREGTTATIEKQLIGQTKLKEQSNVIFEDFSFVHLTGSIIKLCTSSNYNAFRVYTCYINIPNSIEQRRSSKTRLILAFPCEKAYSLTSTVYTGLPVCDLGLNFLFNADFHLVTNRENVRENVPFNTYLRDHVAALFVYLLLNDIDLRKDIHRYYPSINIHQLKHSSWWLTMIDNIYQFMTKHLSDMFDIQTGKAIRYFNADFVSLISKEQLYECADIQVIESDAGFLTIERLKSFQIQPVSILDVLNCFPNREETTSINEFRRQFWLWSQNQDKQWWSELFRHLSQTITSEVVTLMIQKPIFLLSNDRQRQFLPSSNNEQHLLFISDDSSFRIWKKQLTLLYYSSQEEKTALLKSNHVQLLTEDRLIDIICQDHLQLAHSLLINERNDRLIEEIWQDLSYLKSHFNHLNKSTLFLVPVDSTPFFMPIEKAILPTIFGINIRSFMYPTNSPIIQIPYHTAHRHHLIDILQWEDFLLQMNCRRPSIYLPLDYSVSNLPLLPSLTMFTDEKYAQLAESILSAHTENTKDCIRQFPIIDDSKIEQQISPISATFDELIVHDLPSLPRIIIPTHRRTLAINLGVCVEYDLRTCVTILQLLSDEKNKNTDLYIQWLGRLQLYVRQQQDDFNPEILLSLCQLYLPDQEGFYSFKDLLIVSNDEEHRNGILLISKYLKLQLISSSHNQIYWQFKDLFKLLGCSCVININDVYNTIYQASHDKNNFFALGDCNTTLTENGMETMIILFQYLEDLILKCIKEQAETIDLCRTILENKHPTAPCGSREDLQWRFSLTCNSFSKQLMNLTGIQSQQKRIGLPTIDRRLIGKRIDNIVYACLETKIIQELSTDIGKRYFISPIITRTCPLVLALFEINYVERRGKVRWVHTNHNMECHLTQLTEIFRDTMNDSKLDVVSAKYSSIDLILSDFSETESINESDAYNFVNNYPFWIFNKTILLCTGYQKSLQIVALIAVSALTTLLHKRKYIPFEHAKSIAQQKISSCTEFRSNRISNIAGDECSVYTYIDLLFPTDHQSIESMTISIGKHCTIEQDLEENVTTNSSTFVTVDRAAEDRVYRNRVQTQNHTICNDTMRKNSIEPLIMDDAQNIRTGQNAEHFFFTYLQHHYGSIDVTPTKNWRSSARLVTYPQYQRNIDDSVGYDFELQDTREIFTRTSKSTTKYCYFEVKGISGSYHEEHISFYISQNEFEVCQAIATNGTRRECEAYFIVIIENCLDAEKISFGAIINWSSNLSIVRRTVSNYQCKIVSLSIKNSDKSKVEEVISNVNSHQEKSTTISENENRNIMKSSITSGGNAASDFNGNNDFITQSVATKTSDSAATWTSLPPWKQQHQLNQVIRSKNENNNLMVQSTATAGSNLASVLNNLPPQNRRQRQSQQPMRSNERNNNSMSHSASSGNGNTTVANSNSFCHGNQQFQSSIFHARNNNDNGSRQKNNKKK